MKIRKKRLDMEPPLGMTPFMTRFPELGARETRTISVMSPGGDVPMGEYAFQEWYCVDRTCDCRRVLLKVIPRLFPDRELATINFGWESEEFYAKDFGGSLEMAREVQGAALDPLNPQSGYAPAFLRLFRELLIPDREYVDRLARHYQMFKEALRSGKR